MPTPTTEWLLRLIVLIGSSYLLLLVLLFLAQSRLLYLPHLPGRSLDATPRNINLDYETIRLVTADNIQLHGWLVPATSARGTLLFFHGNAGNISHRLESILIFNRLGFEVLIIDYRGYGMSTGTPSEFGTYLDAEAAWQYLIQERGITPDHIVVFGRSLGAGIAANLAANHPSGALILESAATAIPDLAAELYPWLPARWLIRFRYDILGYLTDIQQPLLVVHSREDEIIPIHHGERLFRAAREPKRFLELSGGHNDAIFISRKRYRRGLGAFLDDHFPPQ